MIDRHIAKLGFKCRDKVSGLEGVITSLTFDLYGCIQAIVHPGITDEGTLRETLWFDINRLEITSTRPVMDPPNFTEGHIAEGQKGPGDRPAMSKA